MLSRAAMVAGRYPFHLHLITDYEDKTSGTWPGLDMLPDVTNPDTLSYLSDSSLCGGPSLTWLAPGAGHQADG